jgi:hypothetical protein
MMPLWWYDPVKRWSMVGGGFGVVALAVVLVLFLMVHEPVGASGDSEAVACVEAVGVDRSGSQNSSKVVERWKAQVATIVKRASRCEGIIWAQTVYDRPGTEDVYTRSLQVSGRNDLDMKTNRAKAEEDAAALIVSLMAARASGHTNLLAWFDSVEAHLEDMAGTPIVDATLLSDGINTAGGVNMLSPEFLEADVDELIAKLRLPDCSGWTVRFLGANTTSDGGVDPTLAAKAEEFWRTFVEACGGEVKRYDVATQ